MIRRIARALIPVLLVMAVSTLGYMLIWGWPLLDAFYMTVITVGTVGFREIHPLDGSAQLFTAFVVLAGIVAGGFALSTVFGILVEGRISGVWEGRRMLKRITDMHDHTIIAGVGRVGDVVARALEDAGREFVVIDVSPANLAAARERGWACIHGDATSEEVLISAGIERAGYVVTALNADADNLFVTVTARALNSAVFIIARSSSVTTETKLLRGGADRVVTPNVIGGRRMAMMIEHPRVSDYLDLADGGGGTDVQVQELVVDAPSGLVGVALCEDGLPGDRTARVLLHISPEGDISTAPFQGIVLNTGDRLVILEQVPPVTVR